MGVDARRRATVSTAGAHVGAANTRGARLRRWLHRRGRQDRHPRRGQGQGQPAPAARGQSQGCPTAAAQACRGALPAGRHDERRGSARRQWRPRATGERLCSWPSARWSRRGKAPVFMREGGSIGRRALRYELHAPVISSARACPTTASTRPGSTTSATTTTDAPGIRFLHIAGNDPAVASVHTRAGQPAGQPRKRPGVPGRHDQRKGKPMIEIKGVTRRSHLLR